MKKRYLFIILLNLALTGATIFTQSLADTIQLQGVEIQGARVLNKNTVVIDKDIMNNSSLPDVGTILRNVAGVNGIKKGGSSIDPVVRGFRFS